MTASDITPNDSLTLTGQNNGVNNAVVQFPAFALGQEKIVSQVAVSYTIGGTNNTVSVVMLLNGQVVTSSPMNAGQDTASGDPPLRLRPSDVLQLAFTEQVAPDGPFENYIVTVTFFYSTIPTPRG